VFHKYGDVFFWRIDYRLSPFDVLRAGFETAFRADAAYNPFLLRNVSGLAHHYHDLAS
jgi:hypothetical protein